MEQLVLSKIVEKGFLASPDLYVPHEKIDSFLDFVTKKFNGNLPFVLSNELYQNFIEFEKSSQNSQAIVTLPKLEEDNVTNQQIVKPELEPPEYSFEPKIFHREKIETKLKIKKYYDYQNKKIGLNDWVTYYFDRYNRLREILQNRDELKNAISVGRALKSEGRQNLALIGMVKELRRTLTNTYILELEDPTGIIKVIIRKPELIKKSEEMVEDEVIGIVGTKTKDVIYCENIIFPDIPERPIKKAEEEVYAAFISDIHVGSNMFLPKEFEQAINWISGKLGNNEQRGVASKIRYLFIVGDLVDGIGVYPSQENELLIKDIYTQYSECAKFLANIPDDINIVAIPGNHDALRLAEPQPKFYRDIAEPLFSIPNITMASNPATVNIHNIGKFPGFDILLYHGYSFDYFAANVPALRKTGYSRADLLQEFLLKKRHLAPAHGSSVISPTPSDFLLIDKIPDIFATGHIHYSKVGRYKNIVNICCGCFQDKTSFQEKVGHDPQPGRVPIVNLQTNQVKIMRFR